MNTLDHFSNYKIRSGQMTAYRNTIAHFAEGLRSLTVLPTGYGKTLVEAMIAHHQVTNGHKVVVISREITLANQLRSELERYTGLRVFAHHSDSDASLYANVADIIVGLPTSLNSLVDVADTVIFDESHHAVAETWENISKNKHFVAGFTATPIRTDGKKLSRMFDAVAVNKNIRDGVEEGYLVLPELHLRDLSDYGVMLNDCLQGTTGKTIAFCKSKKMAKEYCEAVNKHAGREVSLYIHSSLQQTNVIKQRFETDPTIRILFAVDMLREGYDFPAIDTVAILKRVKSELVYTQMVGRLTRPVVRVDQETAEERRAAIAASSKPVAKVLEYFGREYTVENHPISKILAPEVEKPVSRIERDWTARRTDVHWQTCYSAVIAEYKRLNILTGEIEDAGLYEILGIDKLAGKLYCGLDTDLDTDKACRDADKIRKAMAKVPDSEKLQTLLSMFSIDEIMETMLGVSRARLNGFEGVESWEHRVLCVDGVTRNGVEASRSLGRNSHYLHGKTRLGGSLQEAYDRAVAGLDKTCERYNINCVDGRVCSASEASRSLGKDRSYLQEVAKRSGISLQEAYDRAVAGLYKHRENHTIKCVDGVVRNASEASRSLGRNPHYLYGKACRLGISPQEAYNRTVAGLDKTHDRHTINCVDGITRNAKEAALSLGKSPNYLRGKAKSLDTSLQEAYDRAVADLNKVNGKPIKCVDGVVRNASDASQSLGKKPGYLRTKASRKGISLQEAYDQSL